MSEHEAARAAGPRAALADVVGAANGRHALAVYRGRRFDVVVIDLGLPDVPGDVLIRALSAAARRPLEVVVITGEREPSLTRARDAGARVIFINRASGGTSSGT